MIESTIDGKIEDEEEQGPGLGSRDGGQRLQHVFTHLNLYLIETCFFIQNTFRFAEDGLRFLG